MSIAKCRFLVAILTFISLGMMLVSTIYGQGDDDYVRIGIIPESGGNHQTQFFQEGSSFNGEFVLNHHMSQPDDYLLTCILDYRQVPCEWNDEAALIYPLQMDSGEQVSTAFKTPVLDGTFHDFYIMALSHVFAEDLSEKYRILSDFNYLFESRVVLLSETATSHELPEIDWQTGDSPMGEVGYEGVVINQLESTEELKAWTVYEATPGEVIPYFIHLGGHPDADPTKFALTAFLNYEQVPFYTQDEVETWALFYDMQPSTEATIPAELTAPTEPGIYEFMVVYTYNPYSMLEESPFDDDREIVPIVSDVASSIRIAIVVK